MAGWRLPSRLRLGPFRTYKSRFIEHPHRGRMRLQRRALRHSEVARSRSRNFWIFPVEVLGKVPNTRVFGTLKRARRSRKKAMTSASFGCAAPGLSSRNAHGVSPHV